VVVGLQFALNDDALRIEHIRLVNDTGDVTLVDYAVGASNHSLVYRSDHVSVMENADALPRAFIVHAAQIVTDVDALARMREYTFDPRPSALLSSGEAMDDPSPEPRGEESVEIISYEPERVVLSVSAQRPGYVILSDVWYPGWVASVGGQPTPIHRANYTFRAVKVDAGVHEIIFEFVPTSFYVGVGISLTTVILYLIGAGYALKKGECEP
jgi:hypothetical protein